jgi:hypothetical protein
MVGRRRGGGSGAARARRRDVDRAETVGSGGIRRREITHGYTRPREVLAK